MQDQPKANELRVDVIRTRKSLPQVPGQHLRRYRSFFEAVVIVANTIDGLIACFTKPTGSWTVIREGDTSGCLLLDIHRDCDADASQWERDRLQARTGILRGPFGGMSKIKISRYVDVKAEWNIRLSRNASWILTDR